jgi:hypothetical protein
MALDGLGFFGADVAEGVRAVKVGSRRSTDRGHFRGCRFLKYCCKTISWSKAWRPA